MTDFFGTTVRSTETNTVVLAPEDLGRHMYLLGASGSGKSSLVRVIFKHLEMANIRMVQSSQPDRRYSCIYIDIKDEDAKLFLGQCEGQTLRDGNIAYLDMNRMGFAINLLELPAHHPEERDSVVSRMVGHIMEMFKEFYGQQHQTFVQMERILKLLMFFLYSNTDSPTLLDLYEIIVRLQADGSKELQRIFQTFTKVSGQEMQTALHSVASLPRDAWVPLINRVESFATDPYLKRRFSAEHSTVDFERMLDPGNITIFRISDAETPRYAHGLAIMAIIIKIWFAVQRRASMLPSDKRSLTVLALDEFQRIRDLSVLTTILSQARSYGLGLALSHQNTAQISTELLETIVGNTATQVCGRISGADASRVARIMDPQFAKEIANQLASQPDFVFTAKMRAQSGDEQAVPVRFKAPVPPKIKISDAVLEAFIDTMKAKFGMPQDVPQSKMSAAGDQKTRWMVHLGAQYLQRTEWTILCSLYRGAKPMTLMDIMRECKFTEHRNVISKTLRRMLDDRLVEVAKTTQKGSVTITWFRHSRKSRQCYFEMEHAQIGTAEDIESVTRRAVEHYLDTDCFVAPARQDPKKGMYRTDLVAYDYGKGISVSVEIESYSEVESHPEHVLLNMTKWKEMGFAQCHVWSRSAKVREIRKRIIDPELREGVTVFVMSE